MTPPTPSYTFVTSAGQRRFVHRWHFANNEVIECNKCDTICKEYEAYSKHWQQQKTKLTEVGDELNTWQKTAIMEHQNDIVSQNIESFMLCHGRVVSDTQQFLLDAGITAIPDLLSVLYATDDCRELIIKLRFYVEIEDEMFMLQSSELEIKHYCDIRESVDVIFSMLLEKLRTFMSCMSWRHIGLQQNVYTIKRIHIQACRRQKRIDEPLNLPLQYKCKLAMPSSSEKSQKLHSAELKCLTRAFEKHLNSANLNYFQPPFPCNIYCFQTCANSLELYAVPYHFSSTPEKLLTTRSFIMINDILGRFQQLQEIGHIKRFLHHTTEDKVLSCSGCHAKYMHTRYLILHRALNCGKNFEILKIDKDFIEIYDNCIELMRCSKWLLYGIIK